MSHELQTQDVAPLSLLQIAVNQNADVDKLEKLLAMQERWEQKQAKKAFLEALSKFQTMVPEIKKSKKAVINSTRGNFSYKFADLGTIVAAIKAPLKECGLSFRWEFEDAGNKLKTTCYISHIDGHTEKTSMESGLDTSGAKNDIQQKGSTQTYLQRYTLIGALGLTTADEDNDGKGLKVTTQEQSKLSQEEILDLWRQSVKGLSKIELNTLFLKNKKVVESDPAIQAIFKARQEELKQVPNQAPVMP